jgi:uncharacterized metal-binding protein YceD (DUF177 family)
MTMSEKGELHRPVDMGGLLDSGRIVDITASADECAAIARRLGLVALRDFHVAGRLDVVTRGRVSSFDARLKAVVTQTCIVTLDPVEAVIDEVIEVRLLSQSETRAQQELDIDIEEDDIEITETGIVDLGDIAVQYLALALDPYPRSAGAAEVVLPVEGGDDDRAPANPFDVLKKLKDKA